MIEKALKCLIFSLFLGILPSLGHASTPSDPGSQRSLKVWDREIEYRLLIKNDPSLTHDGEAFTKNVKGQKISYVVLNHAFLEKEAEALFERFHGENNPSGDLRSFSHQELTKLEEKLLGLQDGKTSLASLEPFKGSFKKLQNVFEEIAWRDLYRGAIEKKGTLPEAKSLFSKEFTARRLKMIERHEAAHLYDILNSTEIHSPAFEKFTEVNAFYAELVYGENPHDTMAQTFAGFIDEITRGKRVDYSVEKILSVIGLLKNCPHFAQRFQSGPLSSRCLEILAKGSAADFIRIGRDLFQENRKSFQSAYLLFKK